MVREKQREMGSEREARGSEKQKKKRNHKKPKKGNTELVLSDGKSMEEKKRKRKEGINVDAEKAIQIIEEEDTSTRAVEEKKKNQSKKKKKKRKVEKKKDDRIGPSEADDGIEMRIGKSNGAKTKRKKDCDTMEEGDVLNKKEDVEHDDVYYISSADEDSSVGMTKWVTEYHQSRPGLKVLQQRIDDFLTAHEARREQERKDREAQAAEGGWTVVVHHKGRKKTTDPESGIAVGSVAKAAVEEELTKKKHKEVAGLDFYRFKKREDRRNEILTLQSKFEQDKKRIQQLRAARKFRPY